MPAILSPGGELGALGAFLSVVIIDVVLAGDNAVVVGMAAANLEKTQRRRAIVWGIVIATVLRILLATIAGIFYGRAWRHERRVAASSSVPGSGAALGSAARNAGWSWRI